MLRRGVHRLLRYERRDAEGDLQALGARALTARTCSA